jgi:hypothetical protein
MLHQVVKKFSAFFGWSFAFHCRNDKELEKARELFVKFSKNNCYDKSFSCLMLAVQNSDKEGYTTN